MNKTIKHWIVIVSLILCLGVFADQKGKLKSINNQIEAIKVKINSLKNEKKSILNDIYEIELRYEKERIESNRIKYYLSQTQGKINRKESERKKLMIEIERSKESVRRILRTLSKLPGNLYVLLFVQVENSRQLYQNYGLFKSLINFQSKVIDGIKDKIAKLEAVKAELQVEKDRLVTLTRQKQRNLGSIYTLKRRKLDFIKQINNDRKNHVKLLSELKLEADRLTAVINKGFTHRFLSLNLKEIKGKLMWPIRGKVISRYGRKKSKKFQTYVFNNGIEIRPTGSDKVLGVHNGDVVFAEYFKGYGNLMIVQHSKNLMTLYGHCEKFLKKKGDKVMKGEVIAVAGSSGSVEGKSLYFEIRNQLQAQDPLKWLRKI
jgi:septal ring factor EnvC (AmiA/AmiB activator)